MEKFELMPESGFSFGWDDKGQKLLFMEHASNAKTGFQASTELKATPACIIPAGHLEPLKICTSGWRPQERPFDILDGLLWTELVREFADTVKFHLPCHIRDVQNTNDPEMRKKNAGRFFACHAEKKLALFFLTHQIKEHDLTLQEALRGKLGELDLPLSARRATIVLGHKPCKNCIDFLQFIRYKTRIDIRTQSCSVFDRHVKRSGFYKSTGSQNAISQNAAYPNMQPDDELQYDGVEILGHWTRNPNGPSSSASSTSEDLVPLSAGNKRRTRMIVDDDDDDDDELDVEEQANPAPPQTPANRDTGRQMSVLSTPSPSLPSVSLPSSSPMPRHLRFGPYLGSPPRIGGTGSPPANWGPAGKPPPNPCFRPPMSEGEPGASHASTAASSSQASSSMPSNANQASHFFESPSPRTDEGQAQAQAQEPRTTLRASVVRTASADSNGSRPGLQVTIRREPVQPGAMGPPPLPHPPRDPRPEQPALAPVQEESADVEILGSRKRQAPDDETEMPVQKRPRTHVEAEDGDDVQIFNPEQGWQSASSLGSRRVGRPFGLVPPLILSRRARREIPVVNPTGLRPVNHHRSAYVDLTESESADSPRPAFTRRPHPMPFLASMASRPPRRYQPYPWRQGTTSRLRPAGRPESIRARKDFPNLQDYRYED